MEVVPTKTIIQLFSKGINSEKIAKKFGISRVAVCARLRKTLSPNQYAELKSNLAKIEREKTKKRVTKTGVCLQCGEKYTFNIHRPQKFCSQNCLSDSRTIYYRKKDGETQKESARNRMRVMRKYSVKYAIYRKRKISANKKLQYAVKTGKIVKPNTCEVCKVEMLQAKIHGHHNDYAKPLKVMWLCNKCHVDQHRKLRKMGVIL